MADTGTINLVNEALALHVTAVLDQSFSQSVDGTGVGGYLNTALANKMASWCCRSSSAAS
jgi:hypothetical protein